MLDFMVELPGKSHNLRLADKKKRMRWAKVHRHWSLEGWKNMLWTDESKLRSLEQTEERTSEKMQGQCF